METFQFSLPGRISTAVNDPTILR